MHSFPLAVGYKSVVGHLHFAISCTADSLPHCIVCKGSSTPFEKTTKNRKGELQFTCLSVRRTTFSTVFLSLVVLLYIGGRTKPDFASWIDCWWCLWELSCS